MFICFSQTIWTYRVHELCDKVLQNWTSFTIWNAGKQGRRLYRSLPQKEKDKVDWTVDFDMLDLFEFDENWIFKVVAFCDVDVKKVGKKYTYEESPAYPRPTLLIVHFKNAQKPFIICVKMVGFEIEDQILSIFVALFLCLSEVYIRFFFLSQGLTNGQFEENLESLNLKEGTDYFHFN